ncbi:MAG: uroporphyrinogen-III synthase [Acidobacteria bacterium]|nr:uroporphyrinogen-III synthase [Acidobacteriota bacterium]
MVRPRILITRSPRQASALADAVRALGAEAILVPTIELTEPSTFEALDAALRRLNSFDWLLFTSANAVDAFYRRVARLSDPQVQGRAACDFAGRVAVIGPATARALEVVGSRADLLPEQAVAESFAEALLPLALQADGLATRFLLVRAEQARDVLPDRLRAAGADVTIAMAYRTVTPQASLGEIQRLFGEKENYPDGVTFTSSSTATSLLALLGEAGMRLPEEVKRISIGPITSQTLREHGIPAHAEAEEASIGSLAAKIAEVFGLGVGESKPLMDKD